MYIMPDDDILYHKLNICILYYSIYYIVYKNIILRLVGCKI